MNPLRIFLSSFTLLCAMNLGCGPDGPPFRQGAVAEVALSSHGQPLHAGDVLLVTSRPQEDAVMGRVALTNPGNAPLEVFSVSLVTEPPGIARVVLDDDELEGLAVGPLGAGRLEITIVRTDGSQEPLERGSLEIHHSPSLHNGDSTVIEIGPHPTGRRLGWSPSVLAFGLVQAEAQAARRLTLMNTGQTTVNVDRMVIEGDAAFTLRGDIQAIAFAEVMRIPAGRTDSVEVYFAPSSATPSDATLFLYDTSVSEVPIAAVPLLGNASGPCLAVTPQTVDFGAKLVGNLSSMDVTVRSCGTEALVLEDVSLVDPLGRFGFDLPSNFDGAVLAPNELLTFPVSYFAAEASAVDPATGEPGWDTASLVLKTNTFSVETAVPLKGMAVDWLCATPDISGPSTVVPQTAIGLQGGQLDGVLPIAHYQWEVEQPVGSTGLFLPSPYVSNPTFVANVAGTYTFRLRIVDSSNAAGCFAAEHVVHVIPDEAIHVELLWETDGNVPGTLLGPQNGTDVDLHFLHPFAKGQDYDGDGVFDGWFDKPFDAAWDNMTPNWGSQSYAADDDPSLDLDDTDGSGPENLNLDQPEEGLTYTVGIHYWDDFGLGSSRVTVRIYIHQQLVWERSNVDLVMGDMWCAATIDWPTGEVRTCEAAGASLDILPNVYPDGFEMY